MIKIRVENKDSLDDLATVDDLAKVLAQSFIGRIYNNPIEFAKELRNNNCINDKEYKELITNIRKRNIEVDFKDE